MIIVFDGANDMVYEVTPEDFLKYWGWEDKKKTD